MRLFAAMRCHATLGKFSKRASPILVAASSAPVLAPSRSTGGTDLAFGGHERIAGIRLRVVIAVDSITNSRLDAVLDSPGNTRGWNHAWTNLITVLTLTDLTDCGIGDLACLIISSQRQRRRFVVGALIAAGCHCWCCATLAEGRCRRQHGQCSSCNARSHTMTFHCLLHRNNLRALDPAG